MGALTAAQRRRVLHCPRCQGHGGRIVEGPTPFTGKGQARIGVTWLCATCRTRWVDYMLAEAWERMLEAGPRVGGTV